MRSGFFNSTITGYDEEGQPIFDRAEDATFFAKYFSQFVGNGVYADPGDCLMVQAGTGLMVTVRPGTCFINGYTGWLESAETLTLDAAHSILNRIDLIVVRYDGVNRDISLKYIKGTEANTPVPPDIERTDVGGSDVYDLELAQIYVSARATAVTQANITDMRLDNTVCGIVASPVEHLDTSKVNAQLTAAFEQWFNEIKGQLSTDAAGNLQNQINEHTTDKTIHNRTGALQLWPGLTAPAGWLGCDGRAVSRTTYADLYAVIGTIYGKGDGSTTFNLPDLTGRVVLGANGSTYTLGSTGGAARHTLTNSELPTITGSIEAYSGDVGFFRKVSGCFTPQTNKSAPVKVEGYAPVVSYNTANFSIGGGQAFNTLPPYTAMHYIIKY